MVASRRSAGFRRRRAACLNPLHCGAVVASRVDAPRRVDERTSQSPSLRGSGRFAQARARAEVEARVSIPFIAGQWSLRGGSGPDSEEDRKSQSPSLRGSGRFPCGTLPPTPALRCLNPLHCGAVVASERPPPHGGGAKEEFQSPSLRGSGRFSPRPWRISRQASCFNPLHCGAVVASLARSGTPVEPPGVSIPFIAGQWSLQRASKGHSVIGPRVSIPFIAGQWSLLATALLIAAATAGFNPLHCGAVVASPRRMAEGQGGDHVSIPVIAGQWSLRPRTTPSSLFGVLLRKRRLPSDHNICTRLPF